MSFLQLGYVGHDIPLTQQQRRAICRDAWKLWWKRRRNLVLYIALLGGSLAIPNLMMWLLTSITHLTDNVRAASSLALLGCPCLPSPWCLSDIATVPWCVA